MPYYLELLARLLLLVSSMVVTNLVRMSKIFEDRGMMEHPICPCGLDCKVTDSPLFVRYKKAIIITNLFLARQHLVYLSCLLG